MTAKIIEGMSNAEYHADPAISKSGLDEFNRSPLHYWLKYISPDKPPVKWTDAFTVGSLFHAKVLEEHTIETDFALEPEVNKRTKAGKEELAAFVEENKGKIFYTKEDMELVIKMADALKKHPIAGPLLEEEGIPESSIFWNFEPVDLPARCRIDKRLTKRNVIVDLKTAVSTAPVAFSRKAHDFRYHVQAAFYSEGYKQAFGEYPEDFYFVAVEKTPPYGVVVMKATEDYLAAGYEAMMKNLYHLSDCLNRNSFPGYGEDKELPLDVPSYARKDYDVFNPTFGEEE